MQWNDIGRILKNMQRSGHENVLRGKVRNILIVYLKASSRELPSEHTVKQNGSVPSGAIRSKQSCRLGVFNQKPFDVNFSAYFEACKDVNLAA
jgi:hypothetical protein